MYCFKSVGSNQIVPILTLMKHLSDKSSFGVFSSDSKLLIPGVSVRNLIFLNLYKSSWYIISNIIST